MTEADWNRRADRDTLYRIPVVALTELAVVTDSRTCASAARAYGPRPGETALPRVHVIKLGRSGFAVLDPLLGNGHSETVRIYDPRWRRLGGWVGP